MEPFPPFLRKPPPSFWVPPSFWSKFKVTPSFWEPSKLMHANYKKHFEVKVLCFVQSIENINNITLFTFSLNHVLLLTLSLVRCWLMTKHFLRGSGGRRLKWCCHNIRRGGYLMMGLITKGVRIWEKVIT